MFNYSVHWRDIEPWRGDPGWLRQSQSTPIQMPGMPDTQQHKYPRETHLTNSASEDDSSSATQSGPAAETAAETTFKEEVCHFSLLLTSCLTSGADPGILPMWFLWHQFLRHQPHLWLHKESQICKVRMRLLHKLSVNSAANSAANSPSTNRSIKCPMFSCDQVHWTYNFNQHYLDCHPGVLPLPEVKPLEAELVFILGATAELPISNKCKRKRNSTAPKAARKKQR